MTETGIPDQSPAGAREPVSSGLAFILSAFPGVGHMYLGLMTRGISLAVTFALLLVVEGVVPINIGPLPFIVVAYAAFDALNAAKRINVGESVADTSLYENYSATPGATRTIGPLLFGLALIFIGAVFLLDNLGIDLHLDLLWPVVPIAIGGWLVLSYFRGPGAEREN